MPKLNERGRLADLEARQRRLAQELEDARRAVRRRYGEIVGELPVETLSERELRDLLSLAIKVGGAPALAALQSLAASRPDGVREPKPAPGPSVS